VQRPRPFDPKVVRLRPLTPPADVAQKAHQVRLFVEAGHVALLVHLPRACEWPLSPAHKELLARHYEAVAEELRGLPWLACGSFLRADRVHAVFLGLPVLQEGRFEPLPRRGLRALLAPGRVRPQVVLRAELSAPDRAAALAGARDALAAGQIVALTQVETSLPDDALAAALAGVPWQPLGPFRVATDAPRRSSSPRAWPTSSPGAAATREAEAALPASARRLRSTTPLHLLPPQWLAVIDPRIHICCGGRACDRPALDETRHSVFCELGPVFRGARPTRRPPRCRSRDRQPLPRPPTAPATAVAPLPPGAG